MPVKIRLARRGRKKAAMYDIVVADSRSPRDGRFIEKLGTYNPLTNPATINFNEDKALEWLLKGAQPTDTAKTMLSHTGVMFRKHLQIGVMKGAVTQEQADARFHEWKNAKDAKTTGTAEKLGTDKAAKKQAALEAETKVNLARAEAIRKKNTPEPIAVEETEEEAPFAAAEEVAPEAPAEEAAPAPVAETPAPEAPAAETAVAETPVAETPATETPVADAPVAEAPAPETPEAPAAEATEEEAPKA